MKMMDKNTQFRVGMTMYNNVCPHTLRGMMDLARVVPNLCMDIEAGSFVAPARCRIAERAIESDDDYLLFVDSDMAFSVDDLHLLLDTLKANKKMGAICSNYVRRDGSMIPIANWVDSKGEWLKPIPQAEKMNPLMEKGKFAPVDVFGAGFLLIDVNALKKLVKKDPDKPLFEAMHTTYQGRRAFATEDHWFIQRLKDAGYKPCVHFGSNVGHWGSTTFYPKIRDIVEEE